MKYQLSVIIIFCFGVILKGQVTFTRSNLPIVMINTNWQEISDEPKIEAEMKIIDNGPGKDNLISDQPNGYNGKIGIELRGSSSQQFPKKPYGFETWDDQGEDIDVGLIGLPKESDWTLNASYNDKSLMRDGLAYILAGSIMDYAPRVRYTELTLNNNYRGVYLLIEKIKRDKERVNIAKLDPEDISGDDLTGGYIIKLDKDTGSNSGEGWVSNYPPFAGAWQSTYFQYEYPSASNINTQQKTYIKNHIDELERVLSSTNYKDTISGYRKYIDTDALADYVIVNELTKNPDAYRLSTFFHKERDSDGGKIKFGPVWDFNLAFGNVDYCTGSDPKGLVILDFNKVCDFDYWVIHYWWKKFLEDEVFYNELKTKWNEYRKNEFSDERLNYLIDSIATLLAEPQERNFKQWPILGEYIWPNAFVGETYASEVQYLKRWLMDRVKYLDRVWNNSVVDITKDFVIFPNPTSDYISVHFKTKLRANARFHCYNSIGQSVDIPILSEGENNIEIDLSNVITGIYYIHIISGEERYSGSIVKI